MELHQLNQIIPLSDLPSGSNNHTLIRKPAITVTIDPKCWNLKKTILPISKIAIHMNE